MAAARGGATPVPAAVKTQQIREMNRRNASVRHGALVGRSPSARRAARVPAASLHVEQPTDNLGASTNVVLHGGIGNFSRAYVAEASLPLFTSSNSISNNSCISLMEDDSDDSDDAAVNAGMGDEQRQQSVTAKGVAAAAVSSGHTEGRKSKKMVVAVRVEVYCGTRRNTTPVQQLVLRADRPLLELRRHIYCLRDREPGAARRRAAMLLLEGTWYEDDGKASVGGNVSAGKKSNNKSRKAAAAPTLAAALTQAWHTANQMPDASHRRRQLVNTKLDATAQSSPPATVPMSDVLLGDLSIAFGRPYTLVHQGDCRHTLVFTDACLVPDDEGSESGGSERGSGPAAWAQCCEPPALRSLAADGMPLPIPSTTAGSCGGDSAGSSSSSSSGGSSTGSNQQPPEPIMVHCARLRREMCTGCATNCARHAEHIVYDDAHADSSPAFFCASCYAALHYTAAGALVYGGFRVFPYYHNRWD